MRRIQIRKPGSYDALELVEEPDPHPGPGEVVVDVEAAGVNYADSIIRMGLYESAKQLHGYPITPGFEVAGTVAALGSGVTGWSVGVLRKPRNLSMAEAATLPTVFLTAWWMIHRQLHPQPDETWLVHSAAGGVGSAVLQLARLAGVRVVGVVGGTHKVDHARAMGADEVIDTSVDDLWSRAETLSRDGYHAIFDANGVKTLQASYDHLAPTGRLLIYGFASMLPRNGRLNWLKLARDWLKTPRFNPLDMTKSNRSVLAANLSFLQSHAPSLREGMQWLLERFESGALEPLPVETWPLADAADAQRRIESGRTIGKLALIPERG